MTKPTEYKVTFRYRRSHSWHIDHLFFYVVLSTNTVSAAASALELLEDDCIRLLGAYFSESIQRCTVIKL